MVIFLSLSVFFIGEKVSVIFTCRRSSSMLECCMFLFVSISVRYVNTWKLTHGSAPMEFRCLTSVEYKHWIQVSYFYLPVMHISGFWQITTAWQSKHCNHSNPVFTSSWSIICRFVLLRSLLVSWTLTWGSYGMSCFGVHVHGNEVCYFEQRHFIAGTQLSLLISSCHV